MGGIKNKLDKLSNKTLFKVPLWLKGDVRRKSDRGIVSDTNPLGSRLPSFSQPSEMLTRNISNTRKPNRWSLYASKTIGSLRLVALTKYLSIACLSLALISTTGLNLYRTYSSSNIESNAIDSNSEVSTLANDSTSISLSFSNATGSCSDTSNPANVCMSIPDGGGIATGGHTVTVATSTKVDSYSLSLSSTTDSTSLVNDADSNTTIPTISSSYPNSQELSNNSWGYSIGTTSSTQPTSYSGLKPVSNPDYLLDSTISTPEKVNEAINIIYGAMVKNPVALRAGNYAVALQYTATATIPAPQIASVNPNSYELGNNSNNRIAITGQNLDSAYRVYLEGPLDSTGSPSATSKQYDCTNLMGIVDDSYNYQLACNIPTDQTNPDLEAGDYTIHVVTQGGEGTIGFSYTESKILSIYDQTDNVRVDWDENMIPVYYTGSTSTARWTSLTPEQIEQNSTTWFDYSGSRTSSGPKWANAVTVKDPEKYKNKGLVVDEADIIGYWVYIPRYAYKVMRKEVTDKVVTDEEAIGMGGFDIRFETNEDFKRTPKSCSTSSSSRYYQDCVDSTYPTEERLANQTAWATHPAFTWQHTQDINGFDKTYELNGFWIGKFETTGSTNQPTVLPNQKHMSQYSGNIGDMYDVAKSMGVADLNNKYGNTTSTSQSSQNNNNLAISTSHMLKNSEWGAVAYLSASKYGAGVNNVQINSQYQPGTDGNGDWSYGVTGCGPSASGATGTYTGTGTLGTNTACNSSDTSRAYNGSKGVLASTTNNVYGVYDMSGGASEYVMGSYTTNASQSSTSQSSNAVKPPYVDLYVNPPFSGIYISNNNLCTWATCGGHALYETKNVQSVSSGSRSWGGTLPNFVSSNGPWFLRGGNASDGSRAGLFYSNGSGGDTNYDYGFRVALLVNT